MAKSDHELITVDQKQYLKMVGELPFSQEQVNLLLKGTAPKHIKERVIPGGGTAKYVTTQYMLSTLNLISGFRWDFEIISEQEKYGQVVVQGKLTVTAKDGKTITKTQYGRATIKLKKSDSKPMDYGNDCKAAASDCIKKCASLLGIAWDVYGQEELREIQIVDAIVEDLNEREEEAEANLVPIEKIKKEVSAMLAVMSASDKMRYLKEHAGIIKEDSLTDTEYRYLHSKQAQAVKTNVKNKKEEEQQS